MKTETAKKIRHLVRTKKKPTRRHGPLWGINIETGMIARNSRPDSGLAVRDVAAHFGAAMKILAAQIDPENLCEAAKYAKSICLIREAAGALMNTAAALERRAHQK